MISAVKKELVGFGLLAILAAVPQAALAQVVASEKAFLRQTVAGTEIEIEYSRPSMRGRAPMFGDEIPWGTSWTGANANTILRFSKPVMLAGESVEAGSYGLWIEPREDSPWVVALFSDTTLFHTAHPPIADGEIIVEVPRQYASDFVETLTLHFPAVTGVTATLELRWGSVALPMELEVESGLVFAVSEDEARALEGDWEMVSGRNPDRPGMPISFEHNSQSGRIEGSWTQGGTDVPVLLVRKAEGIYQLGMMIGDQLGSVIDTWFFEFVLGEDGRAESFEVRGADDELRYSGKRAGG